MTSIREPDEEELRQLKATLSQLSSQLDLHPTSSDHKELLQLREELVQLIQLKEEQLLEDKKAALSALVQSLAETCAPTEKLEQPEETHKQSVVCDNEEDDKWIGKRCSIPGWTSNGKFILQNAVVSELVKQDDGLDRPTTYARVYFAHPTRPSDAPCREFIEHGTCHRGIRCHASHGKVVAIEDLSPWHEPDVTKFSREGQSCLVKDTCNPYGLWRHARLLHADLNSQSCVVEWGHAFARDRQSSSKRKSYNDLEQSVANVSMDAVHLLSDDEDSGGEGSDTDKQDDISSSSSDSDTLDGIEQMDRRDSYSSFSAATGSAHRPGISKPRSKVTFVAGGVLSPEDVLKAIPYDDPTPTEPIHSTDSETQDTLGAWEVHTRGIGSRLLSKLGYNGTSGLGSYGQGRKLPVALILEKFQIRPRKWNKRPTLDLLVRPQQEGRRQKRRKLRPTCTENSQQEGPSKIAQPSVFNLLNTALNRCEDISSDFEKPSTTASDLRASKTEPCLTELSESASRVESFRLHEEIERTLRKMNDVRKSIERNQNKDRIVTKQAEQRLSGLQAQLAELRRSERALQSSRQKMTKSKKLRIF